ncbi:MAG: peptide deformylase [Clostridiales Family XIII bacterium]|jgi:peptide deformylase|nr:peptide deformylase [Clostridiales Family XIII bacterium]
MALRNILTEGDETLRKTSREVVAFDGKLAQLLDDMWETMADASGIGLAAPQVGILRRAVVIDVTPPPDAEDRSDKKNKAAPEPLRVELVNPVILSSEGETAESEGCLSVPGLSGVVKRPTRVTVTAFDRDGNAFTIEGTGMLAKAISHEMDHLNGILFTDKAESLEEAGQ